MALGQLHGPVMEDLGSQGNEPAHFVIGDPVEALRVGMEPGILVLDPVHIRVDLA